MGAQMIAKTRPIRPDRGATSDGRKKTKPKRSPKKSARRRNPKTGY
jgi:hypothetical protein